jgi:flavin-binding protein dodecin
MALQRFFIGTSPGGNLEEAIQDALKKARESFEKDTAWEIKQIAQNQLKLGPISVKIRVGKGKGEGGGIGPR